MAARALALVLAFAVVAAFAGAAAAAVASSEPRGFPEGTAAREAPAHWRLAGAANAAEQLTMYIFLKLENAHELEPLLYRVSDPRSAQYGQYLSVEQLAAQFGAAAATRRAVDEWLAAGGVVAGEWVATGDAVRASGSVAQWEALLRVRFHRFERTDSAVASASAVRTLDAYSLPAAVARHVALVGGAADFPLRGRSNGVQRAAVAAAEPSSTTPKLIKTRYNVTATGQAADNLQAPASFLQQYYSPSDLTKFQSVFGLPDQPVTKELGPNDASNPGTEATLDIQYITAIAQGVPTWFVSTGGTDNGGQETFLPWLYIMSNSSVWPWVNSVSYGDVESTISEAYRSRVDQEFIKAAVRGFSILFAAGDSGVGCTNKGCVQTPDWPASSPYVTTVGGTYLYSATVEAGVAFGGGGFSNYAARPAYQAAAVEHYLQTSSPLPPSASYNASGRGYPDISALSTAFAIILNGQQLHVDGTSCAAPTASAIVSLLNDLRLQAAKPTLGFLNPLLYQLAANGTHGIYDVTVGLNPNGCCQGFRAAPGWDAISGVGTLNYGLLAPIISSL